MKTNTTISKGEFLLHLFKALSMWFFHVWNQSNLSCKKQRKSFVILQERFFCMHTIRFDIRYLTLCNILLQNLSASFTGYRVSSFSFQSKQLRPPPLLADKPLISPHVVAKSGVVDKPHICSRSFIASLCDA